MGEFITIKMVKFRGEAVGGSTGRYKYGENTTTIQTPKPPFTLRKRYIISNIQKKKTLLLFSASELFFFTWRKRTYDSHSHPETQRKPLQLIRGSASLSWPVSDWAFRSSCESMQRLRRWRVRGAPWWVTGIMTWHRAPNFMHFYIRGNSLQNYHMLCSVWSPPKWVISWPLGNLYSTPQPFERYVQPQIGIILHKDQG